MLFVIVIPSNTSVIVKYVASVIRCKRHSFQLRLGIVYCVHLKYSRSKFKKEILTVGFDKIVAGGAKF